MKYYKVLRNGRSCHGGNCEWSLPTKNADGSWTPGDWMPAIEYPIVMCAKGYHLCRPQDLSYWLDEEIYEVEIRRSGVIMEGDNKVVVRQCRLLRKVETWTEKAARLFAVWCAREALALVGSFDPASVEACNVAERFAHGQATHEELATARSNVWITSFATAPAVEAASDAASPNAYDAASDTAWELIRIAMAKVTEKAVGRVVRKDVWDTELTIARKAQVEKLLELLEETEDG